MKSELETIALEAANETDWTRGDTENILDYTNLLIAKLNKRGWQLVPKIKDAEDTPEQLGQGHETVQRIWDSQMNTPDKCSQCGFPEREHHHGGACYGICGKFDRVSIQQPAGYTLVPNEPTPEMLRATEYILLSVYGKPEGVSRLSKDAYKAMIAAAPQFTEKEQAK